MKYMIIMPDGYGLPLTGIQLNRNFDIIKYGRE